mgnify:CR=1 FL=1
MTTRPVRITVVGAGRCDDATASIAERVGQEIARRGGILLCGGLGGVMKAAARGARSAGGTTVGILPGKDADDANAYIDIPIATGMGEARNVLNVRAGDAVVALKGSHGTLSEVALALKMGVPVVVLDDTMALPGTVRAESPEDAVARALQLIAGVR